MKQELTIAVDFDGTICFNKYPKLGSPIPHAIEGLKRIIRNKHRIALHTMRSGDPLQDAVDFLENQGISLYAINVDPRQHTWTRSPKMYADIYIDDCALGCPMIWGNTKMYTGSALSTLHEPHYVDWLGVIQLLEERNLLPLK